MRKKLLLLMTTALLLCCMCLPVMAASVTKGDTPVTTITPNTTKTTYAFSFDQGDVLGGSNYGTVIPIKLTSSGYFEVSSTLNTSYLDDSMDIELYKDAACTDATSDLLWLYMYKDTVSDTDSAYLPAGTYYLCVKTHPYNETPVFNYSGKLSLRFVSNADRSLANNKKTLISRNDSGTYLKISVPKTGYVTVTGTQGSRVALYSSSKKLLNTGDISLSSTNGGKATFAVKKGTYYIRTKTYDTTYTISYTFSTDPSFKSGKTLTIYPADNKQYTYVKYKPGKNGTLTLTKGGYDCSCYVTLCNSSKKALSEEVYTSNSKYYKKTVFAIKKNTTYYVRIKASYTGKLTYKATFTTVNEKSGSKVSNAVSIKKGKTAKGLILPGESKKDYYKMTVSKAQVVNIKVGGSAYTGKIRVNIYSDKKLKKKMGTITIFLGDCSGKYNMYTAGSKKLRKGTYYIVVQRDGSKTNGSYYVNWM